MIVRRLGVVGSTMEEARGLVEEERGSEERGTRGLVGAVLADVQTAGRGRQGRPWVTFDAPYGMAVTFILRPAAGVHLPLVAALALLDGIRNSELGIRREGLRVKWPNDLLLDGKKVAGVLCENMGTRASLVGMGVNIRNEVARNEERGGLVIPEGFVGGFLGLEVTPEALAERVGACLLEKMALYEAHGWRVFHEDYLHHCATIGQNIVWRKGMADELTGYVRGLTQDGHLELVDDNGTVHVISSGEIFDKR